MVLLRNSAQDGRKGGKLQQRWLGPYEITEFVGKGVYKLINPKSVCTLKKEVNICRLKIYHESQSTKQVAKHESSVPESSVPVLLQSVTVMMYCVALGYVSMLLVYFIFKLNQYSILFYEG